MTDHWIWSSLDGFSLFVCLFGIYGKSTFVGLLTPNPFLYKKKQLYFKQFRLA